MKLYVVRAVLCAGIWVTSTLFSMEQKDPVAEFCECVNEINFGLQEIDEAVCLLDRRAYQEDRRSFYWASKKMVQLFAANAHELCSRNNAAQSPMLYVLQKYYDAKYTLQNEPCFGDTWIVLIINRFIIEGADVTVCNDKGWIPLHFAALTRNVELVKLLIDKSRLKVNTQSLSVKYTPLHIVFAVGDVDVAKALSLYSPYIDLTVCSDSGATPFHYLAGKCQGGYQTFEGRSAWSNEESYQAALNNRLEMCVIFECAYKDVSIKDSDGKTAIDYAQELGHHELVGMFKKISNSEICSIVASRKTISEKIETINSDDKRNK